MTQIFTTKAVQKNKSLPNDRFGPTNDEGDVYVPGFCYLGLAFVASHSCATGTLFNIKMPGQKEHHNIYLTYKEVSTDSKKINMNIDKIIINDKVFHYLNSPI